MLRISDSDAAGAGGWRRTFPRLTSVQLCALVSDIESYPACVPGSLQARIVERGETVWKVENVFGFGPVRSRFMSRAERDPPHRLDITSREEPWRDFRMNWRFEDVGGGCRLSCALALVFRSPLLARLAHMASGEMERGVVSAFERRARLVYRDTAPPA